MRISEDDFCQLKKKTKFLGGTVSPLKKKTKSVQMMLSRVVKNVNNKENIIIVVIVINNNNKRGTVLATTRANLAQFEPLFIFRRF